jgi:3-dehydro-L-gulonate 2-dehydrogenase
MAMSQFSYGALAEYRSRGEKLPVIGGYDSEGNLTDDPAAIEASGRPLPIGFWKGSGLALMLDMLAAVLSGGLATHQIGTNPYEETSLSQVFLALDLASADNKAGEIVEQILQHLRSGSDDSGSVRYPGERTLETRKRNLLEGIPVDEAIWREVKMQMLDA